MSTFPVSPSIYLTTIDQQSVKESQFERQNTGNRRFQNLQIVVTTIPPQCIPVQVIASTKYLIVLNEHRETPHRISEHSDIYSRRRKMGEDNVLGHYSINNELLQTLKSLWHQPECTLVCATDRVSRTMWGQVVMLFFT